MSDNIIFVRSYPFRETEIFPRHTRLGIYVCSQEPITGLCREPDAFSLRLFLQLLLDQY
jgi:hypothetical protein